MQSVREPSARASRRRPEANCTSVRSARLSSAGPASRLRLPGPRFFSLQTHRPTSPAPRCRSTAAGRRCDAAQNTLQSSRMFWQRKLPHWVPEDTILFVSLRLAGTRHGCETGLKDPRIADIVVEALLYGESFRHSYDLFAWVIMSNHVHLVLKPHG